MKSYLPSKHGRRPKHSLVNKICSTLILLLLVHVAFSPKVLANYQPGISVKGKVIDTEGSPLISASVKEKGTDKGTFTNNKGEFTINVTKKDAILSVTSIGYSGKDQPLNGQTFIEIILSSTENSLDQIVVIGYGTQKKSDLTGSVSTVKSDQLKAAPISNAVQGLQGRVAGAQIINTSGAKPGGDVTIRIRGYNSINSGNGPLYVINGFAGVGDLNSINPSDIESIDILKDASATAIYGARGANGVVLITTKKGAAGKPVVSLDYSEGIQTVYKRYDLVNATEFAELVNSVRMADGLSQVFSDPSSFGEGTDWQKEFFKPAPVRNAQLSISGGDTKTKYAISAGYFSQKGIEIGSGYRRTTLSVNLESQLSDKFSVGAYMYGADIANDQDNPAAASAALTISPILNVRGTDGKYMTNADLASQYGFPFYSKGNPIAMAMDIENTTTQSHLIGNTFLQYKINKDFTLKTTFGADLNYGRYAYYAPDGTPDGGTINQGGSAQLSTSRYMSLLNENTLSYVKKLENQEFNFVAGITFQGLQSNGLTASARGFTDDFYKYNNLGLGSIQNPSQSTTDSYNLNSYFIRGNYQLQNKYMATFTTRVDGSSKFGKNNKYGFFPSGALAWRISEEEFLNNSETINNLKLRASYGITGNQDIGSFQALGNVGGSQYIFGDTRVVGAQPLSIANPDLKWERTAQFDIGFDLGLFKERLSLVVDYYKKVTSDLLLAKPIPYTSGFQTSLQNTGKVSNTGLELSVNSINIKNNNFNWRTGFNITFNKNKVLDLGGVNEIISNGYLYYFGDYSIARVGQPIGMFYNYQFDGIWQTGDDIAHSAQPNAKPGDQKFKDVNQDGVINSNDRVIIGSPHPKFIYGFSNNFTWKGFDLEVLMNGSQGNKLINDSYIDIKFPNGTTTATRNTYLNRWTPENPSNTNMRAGSDIDPSSSSQYMEDASYLRISNILLGYNLPNTVLNKFISKARVYISVQNLHTFTKYSGFNPEANTYGSDNLRLGYDYSFYPQARTINLGVNLIF